MVSGFAGFLTPGEMDRNSQAFMQFNLAPPELPRLEQTLGLLVHQFLEHLIRKRLVFQNHCLLKLIDSSFGQGSGLPLTNQIDILPRNNPVYKVTTKLVGESPKGIQLDSICDLVVFNSCDRGYLDA